MATLHDAFNVSRIVMGTPLLKNPVITDEPKHTWPCPADAKDRSGCTLKDVLPIMRDHYDLCFIDGDHGFKGVERDFLTLLGRCTTYMFHDIVNNRAMGVDPFWKKMRASEYTYGDYIFELEECIYQPKESDHRMMGIGLVTFLKDHATLAKAGPIRKPPELGSTNHCPANTGSVIAWPCTRKK